jgi:hypothetical protein
MGAAASYPRVVIRASWNVRRSARVYYRCFRAAALLLMAVAPNVPRAYAQVEISINPMMVKGPRDAAVTIIEFSDYQ